MTNLDSILKSRDISFLTKICIVKALFFPVVMYRCENWTIKKAERQRIYAFKLWCWRRLWDCKEIKPVNPKGNQTWIFIGRTDTEAEVAILLTTWCKVPIHWKSPWCWERLRAGGKGGNRGWDGWMASSTQWTWVWASSRKWWRTEKPGMLQSVGLEKVRHDWLNDNIKNRSKYLLLDFS